MVAISLRCSEALYLRPHLRCPSETEDEARSRSRGTWPRVEGERVGLFGA